MAGFDAVTFRDLGPSPVRPAHMRLEFVDGVGKRNVVSMHTSEAQRLIHAGMRAMPFSPDPGQVSNAPAYVSETVTLGRHPNGDVVLIFEVLGGGGIAFTLDKAQQDMVRERLTAGRQQ